MTPGSASLTDRRTPCLNKAMAIDRRTHTLMAVLAALLGHPYDDHYGLELARRAGVRPGSIYPILARLEAEGWLTGYWEDIDESAEGRRRRKYFRLTGEGARCGSAELSRWRSELQGASQLRLRPNGSPA
jgi:PadR family transcriptional regulator PadR